MSSSTNRFKHESLEDSKSIVKYLKALEEGFKNEALLFCSDEKRLVVKPTGLINLEVEAKRKNEDIKLTLRFKWSESKVSEEKNSPLNIQPISED